MKPHYKYCWKTKEWHLTFRIDFMPAFIVPGCGDHKWIDDVLKEDRPRYSFNRIKKAIADIIKAP